MPSVSEVVALVEKAGLVVQKNPSTHSHTLWDIVDPKSGTILTGISAHAGKQGGDNNWHFQIRRILRKAGFQIEFGGNRKKKNRAGHKRKPAIDLEALKIAQDQAIAAGHRPPLLEDIEGDRDFLTRSARGNNNPYTEEATGEVVKDMPTGVDSPRAWATAQRLKKCLELRGPELSRRAGERLIAQHGDKRGLRPGGGTHAEFVRIAMEEIAPQRGLRAWKSVDSGQQSISAIVKAEKPGMSVWSMDLINATIDYLDGMKWNEIDLDKIKMVPPTHVEDIKGKKSDDQVLKREELEGLDDVPDSTPPQEGPDLTTYDVAIEMIDEYEEILRQIAQIAGAKGTDSGTWQGVSNKSETAKLVVSQLRLDYDEVVRRSNALQLQYEELEERVTNVVNVTNGISDQYATVLLDLLKNFDTTPTKRATTDKRDEKQATTLDLILTRLDKLAGI